MLYEIKYLTATNTKGVRIKITKIDNGEAITLARDYALNFLNQVEAHFNSLGLKIDDISAYKSGVDIAVVTPK